MWTGKSRAPDSIDMHLFFPALVLCAALLAGCDKALRDEAALPKPEHFLVMSYNLDGLGELDRDGDGLAEEAKPAGEVDAILSMILSTHPDVLCLQEIGTQADFDLLRNGLATGGLNFKFAEFVHTPHSPMNLALLSRFPLIDVTYHTNDIYSMGSVTVPTTHGYLEATVSVNPAYQFTIFNANLKSRDYHALGQTEMRRNEARLLNNHIRDVLDQPNRPNLVVVGTFHDRIQSAALRAVTGQKQEYLADAPIADPAGDIWTVFDADEEVYRRSDYVLISSSMMTELIPEHSFIPRSDETRLASAHRPLVAAFLFRNVVPEGPGLYHP
jgi:hypothetical protein